MAACGDDSEPDASREDVHDDAQRNRARAEIWRSRSQVQAPSPKASGTARYIPLKHDADASYIERTTE